MYIFNILQTQIRNRLPGVVVCGPLTESKHHSSVESRKKHQIVKIYIKFNGIHWHFTTKVISLIEFPIVVWFPTAYAVSAQTSADELYRIMLFRRNLAWAGFERTPSVVICTDCVCSWKSNREFIFYSRRFQFIYWMLWLVFKWWNRISVAG
jgi:hypothetical protein